MSDDLRSRQSAGTYPRDFSALLRDHTFSTDNFSSQHEKTPNVNSKALSEGKSMARGCTEEGVGNGNLMYETAMSKLRIKLREKVARQSTDIEPPDPCVSVAMISSPALSNHLSPSGKFVEE